MSEISSSASSSLKNPIFLEKFQNKDKILQEEMLIEAVSVGNVKKLETLINLHVSVDTQEYILQEHLKNPWTPVLIATFKNFLPCLQILIENGADVNFRDIDGVTALHLAADKGHLNCLKALLQAGANGNVFTDTKMDFGKVFYKRTTPLHVATRHNHVHCVEQLMLYNVDHNCIDVRGVCPLYTAVKYGFDLCVQVILRNAVRPTVFSTSSFTRHTPLHIAVERGMINSVKELLNFEFDVNEKNHDGDTPLHICVQTFFSGPETSLKLLKLLVLCGQNCDINSRDSKGLTPLYYVVYEAKYRRPDMANFLIGYGADINITFGEFMPVFPFEYYSNNPETSILETCLKCTLIPPRLRDLEDIRYDSVDQMIKNRLNQRSFLYVNGRVPGIEHPTPRALVNFVYPNVDEKEAWYRKRINKSIPSLMHQCRYAIRSFMCYKNYKYIKNFNIPYALKSFLLLGADHVID